MLPAVSLVSFKFYAFVKFSQPIEKGRWKGEERQDRTCTLCAKGEMKDEAHVLLVCSTYHRERTELFNNRDQEWLLQMLLGEGPSQREKRQYIQSEVAKF